LGILDLDLQNRCLLSKWLYKLINEEGMWQTLLRNKYLKDRMITQVEYMPGDSHFCPRLMKVKSDFLRLGKFEIGDGSQVRFWEDAWLGNIAFKNLFPTLYDIVRKKSVTIAKAFSSNPLNVSFRRHLFGHDLIAWHTIVAMISNVQLTGQKDTFIWLAQQNRKFSARSMYRVLVVPHILPRDHVIWKLKLLVKIKIFIWYLIKGVALTKYNLAKRQRKGSFKCCYYNMDESIQHLFFDCPYASMESCTSFF
jgi:hypothetical protein